MGILISSSTISTTQSSPIINTGVTCQNYFLLLATGGRVCVNTCLKRLGSVLSCHFPHTSVRVFITMPGDKQLPHWISFHCPWKVGIDHISYNECKIYLVHWDCCPGEENLSFFSPESSNIALNCAVISEYLSRWMKKPEEFCSVQHKHWFRHAYSSLMVVHRLCPGESVEWMGLWGWMMFLNGILHYIPRHGLARADLCNHEQQVGLDGIPSTANNFALKALKPDPRQEKLPIRAAYFLCRDHTQTHTHSHTLKHNKEYARW